MVHQWRLIMIRGRIHILFLLLCATFSHVSLVSFNFFSRKDHTPVNPLRVLPNGALDPAQYDAPAADSNYFNQLKIGRHDRLSLPSSLHDLKNYELCHLPSILQEGPSCVWYTALNAKAIQTIVQRQEPLTPTTISRYLIKQLIPFLRHNDHFFNQLGLTTLMGVSPLKATKLLPHLGLTNYYSMFITSDKRDELWVFHDNLPELPHQAWAIPFPPQCDAKMSVVLDSDLHALLKMIKQKSEPVSHILLGVPSEGNVLHAVLLTIIKRGDQKPLILYLNSNGTSLNLSFLERWIDSTGHTENTYISNFIKALDNA